uniref:Ornithine decarboxylase antizyme n=1 Tax=Syphacia muris TaxID=451379 RepID=A0A0N5AWB7_9BILA
MRSIFKFFAFLVVIEATLASGVAPDIPNAQFDGERLKILEGLVKEVSAEWCCHLADKDTLALFLPLNKGVSSLSKDAFVSLLEFCEEELHVKRVLICVNVKAVTNEILSCFKFVGFTPLHPDHYPSNLDPELLFAMVYTV